MKIIKKIAGGAGFSVVEFGKEIFRSGTGTKPSKPSTVYGAPSVQFYLGRPMTARERRQWNRRGVLQY